MPLIGAKKVKQAMQDTKKPLNMKLKGIYLQGLGNIANGTPVDEGRARSNWFLKEGSPSTQVTDSVSGDPHLTSMPNWVLGVKLYYANNLPYINALEYGGYTGVGPKTKAGAGGIYSDQSVNGWVRSEVLVMRSAIRRI